MAETGKMGTAAEHTTVLMVEDNVNVLHLNRSVLERQGYTVCCAETLYAARKQLAAHPEIAVAVLDILLPDGNGLTFASEVKQTIGCPVLMLTSKRGHEDIVEGLTGAADDYLTKPYRIEELTARIKALLVKGKEIPVQIHKGALTLDVPSARAFLSGGDLLLSPREFAVLLKLVRHEGAFVSSQTLYEAAWNLPASCDTNTLKSTISRLRKKLTGSGYGIESERGEGYGFQRNSLG